MINDHALTRTESLAMGDNQAQTCSLTDAVDCSKMHMHNRIIGLDCLIDPLDLPESDLDALIILNQ